MLKRDKTYIESNIINKDGLYFTKKKLIIEIPSWYRDKSLYDISDNVYVYGVFAFIMDDKYSVSIIPTVLPVNPVMTTEIERNGEKYLQLHFAPNDKIFVNDKTIMHSYLSYNFFEGYYMQAKLPWFIEYEDLVKVLDNTVKYAGSNLGANYIVNEVVTSFIARQEQDKKLFYRQNPKSNISYVDIMDVRYSALNTVSKLAGNYFDESLTSALLQKEKSPTTLEKLVRN